MILFDQTNQIKKEIVNAHDYVDNSEKLELNLRSVWIEGEGGGVEQHRFGLKLAYFQPILLYSLYFPTSPPPPQNPNGPLVFPMSMMQILTKLVI